MNTTRWNRIRYTLYAPVYNAIVRVGRPRRRSIELLALRPGERVLIVGSGPGPDLPFLPPGVHVTAIDLTPAMVKRLQRNARRRGIAVDARVMDAERLEFPDASFDAVILHLIVAVVPDPVACLREAVRVTRPGGRLTIFDKFVPPGRPVTMKRRLLNAVANVVATDVTRAIEPLLAPLPVTVERDEPALLGEQFRILLLRRTQG